MVDLRSLQRSMADTILGQAPDDQLLASVRSGGLSPEDRLRIHQNNYRESLSDALLGLFPLCQAFVGELFLKQALRHFVSNHPPTEAALYGYGAAIPGFLRTCPGTETVPYLADVARLEWLTHELANAQEEPAFDDLRAAQGALAAGRGLELHANARLLISAYPVYDLWRAASGQLAPEDLDTTCGGQTVLLVLHEGQVFYQAVEGQIHDLLVAIIGGAGFASIETEQLEELIERGAIALLRS